MPNYGRRKNPYMNNRNLKIKDLGNVVTTVFKTVPLAACLNIAGHVFLGIFPAMITFIAAETVDLITQSILGQSVVFESIIFYLILLVCTYGVRSLISIMIGVTLNVSLFENFLQKQRIQLVKKTAELALIDLEKNEVLDLRKKAEQCLEHETFPMVFYSLILLLQGMTSVVSVACVLATYDILFLFVSVISIVPYCIIRAIRGGQFYKIKVKQIKETREYDYLMDLFYDKRSIKEMRVQGFQDYLQDKYGTVRNKKNAELWKHTEKELRALSFCDLIKTSGYVIGIIWAIVLIYYGRISLGAFSACIAAFVSMQDATRSVLIQVANINEKLKFVVDYDKFFSLHEEQEKTRMLSDVLSEIKFDRVTFAYPNVDENAVENISFSIFRGEKVAIIGENGSGKTTLIKLMLGLYMPMSGNIFINGQSLSEINHKSYLRNFSLILQDFVRYKLTLGENIYISDYENRNDTFRIQELIDDLGFENIDMHTQVGKEFEGLEFSGGEWQKIALSRAMFRRSDFIILDEPTSAMDPIAEYSALSELIQTEKDKGLILISHRVGLCRKMDKIIVLHHGHIAQIGDHATLMQEDGIYKDLFLAQSHWYE